MEDSIKVLKRNERHLSIRTTITDQTVNRIGEITDYFKELGVHTLHLEALYSLGRATQTESNLGQPIVKDWVNAAINALKWGKQNNKLVTIHALIHFFNPNLCNFCGPMCGNTTVINHQGMLTACSEVVDDGNKD